MLQAIMKLQKSDRELSRTVNSQPVCAKVARRRAVDEIDR